MGNSNTVPTCDQGGPVFYSDISDNDFQVADTHLIITAPKATDKWYKSGKYTVKWDTDSPVGLVSLWWEQAGTGVWNLYHPSLANNGSAQFTVPDAAQPGQIQVRVCIGYDIVDGKFVPQCRDIHAESPAINLVQDSVRITSPNGGEEYPSGSSQNITWVSDTDKPQASLWWTEDSSTNRWFLISDHEPNDGTARWIIPDGLTNKARVAVCLRDNSTSKADFNSCAVYGQPAGLFDESDADFKVGEGINVKVISPNGGEFLTANEVYKIKWSSNAVGNSCKVESSTDSGASWALIGFAPSGSRELDWTVPNTATSKGRVKVTCQTAPDKFDISDGDFFIVGGPIASTKLTEALINGKFVTTVGEHFVIKTNSNNAAGSTWGELGSDFIGKLSGTWTPGTVAHLGHLRFLINLDGSVMPVPQGRYGHKLVRGFGGGLFGVIGGASWMKETEVVTAGNTEVFKNFWVIDDNTHPVYRTGTDFKFDFGKTANVPTFTYQYVGNISYALVNNKWIGTNGSQATGKYSNGSNTYTGTQLDANFALKDSSGTAKKGRAFFGFAGIPGSQLVAGGLENTPLASSEYEKVPQNGKIYFRIPIAATDRAELFKGTRFETETGYTNSLNFSADNGFKPAYNLQAFEVGGKAVFYSGQTNFQLALTTQAKGFAQDAHIPDYHIPFNPKTFMYKPPADNFAERWFPMADIGIQGVTNQFSYVRVSPGITTLSSGSQMQFSARSYNANGSQIPGAVCTWSLGNNASGLGTIDHTTGRFQSDEVPNYRHVSRGVRADCTVAGVTVSGFADLGVYPSGSNAPEPIFSLVEVNPESAVTIPGTPRTFRVSAFDEYYSPINSPLTYVWTLSDSKLGTLSGDSTKDVVFTASKTAAPGSYPGALRVLVTGEDPNGGQRIFAGSSTINIPENLLDDGSSADAFAADYLAASGTTNPIMAIYRFGGVQSDRFQTLGLFGKGAITGTLDVVTSPIAPDGYNGSDVVVTLKNGLGEPVFETSLGDRYAVYIDTSRPSTEPLVTTDRSFNPGKSERVERLGEVVPGTGHNQEMVYVDSNGQAKFRIYSNATTPGINVNGHVEITGRAVSLLVPGLTDQLVVQDIRDWPSQLQSTITADKLKIAADGVDKARVTVTLKDYLGNPVPPYYVKLVSSRGEVDTITPTSKATVNGVVTFDVKSSTKGLATIQAFFGRTQAELDTNPVPLIETLTLNFTASISSLIPNQIHQGETLLDSVEAIGNQTSWATGKTTVEYVSPSRTGLSITSASDHIKANGVSKTTMTINAPEHPHTQIDLTLVSGSGSLNVNTVSTDAAGKATFKYQSGTTPGLVKIRAKVSGMATAPSDEIWFMLEDNRAHPYELDIFASPPGALAPGESAVIRGALYKYVGTQKVLITDSANFNFVSDKGSFNPDSADSDNGVAQSTFTRGATGGPAQVLVTVDFDSVKLGAKLIIDQTDTSHDLTADAPTIVNKLKLTVANLTASSDAVIGTWLFRAITDISPDGTPDDQKTYEVVDYPLEVLATGVPTGPELTSINPNFGYRNTDDVDVTISGSNAFFTQGSSVVTFTPVGGASEPIVVKSVSVSNSNELVATIKIPNTARMGYWNVKVVTGTRVAELPGDFDFLVTTPSDTVIDVVPSPNRIPRDGHATSSITTFVGHLDRVTGEITPLPNVDVTFSIGDDAGHIAPTEDGTPPPGIKTDIHGLVHNTYTTDAGDESDDVEIQATVTIDGVPASNTGLLIKEVDAGYNFLLTANPTSLPAIGGSSNLLATVKDREGNVVANGTPVKFIVVGVGSASPVNTTVAGGQGQASSVYSVGAQTLPQLVHVVARATIQGIGDVYSNEVIIPIGVDSSKYRLSVVANPTSVEAGGSTRSSVIATLTFVGSGNPVPVPNWPVTFALNYHGVGDYLTLLTGTTNASGQLTTQFVPGLFSGNVLVTASPIALAPGSAIITKTVGQTVSRELSTITAVPKYVPADNTAFSVITVTVRNGNNVGLANKQVTLTATHGTISPAPTATTNALGQATFYIKDGTVETSDLTATVDNVSLTTQVFFVDPASVVAVTLDTIVPLEAKSYDHLVKLFLREPVSGALPVIDEAYFTDATDHVLGLPTIYLKPNVSYSYWAKGRYHLARIKPVQTATTGTVSINFTATYRGVAKGLLIGDLSPDQNNNLPTFWHDNAINAVDVVKIIQAWFKNSYEADFTSDGLVNSVDFTYWSFNYGPGAPQP